MRIPTATYRIQFTPDFGFAKAEAIAAYLAELGISDMYASPVFRARKGSTHGYDVIDPATLNPELGSEKDFADLSATMKRLGLGWLQDIVPNHMAFDAQNPYLADVLENGPASRHAEFFDIDWNHYYEAIRGKVLTPFLGRLYGQALEAGEIRLGYAAAGFAVAYFDLRFPLKPESYLSILDTAIEALRRQLGEDHPDYIQMLGVLYVLQTLHAEAQDGERSDQVRFIKQTLWSLYRKNRAVQQAVDAAVQSYNGRIGEPESFNALEVLLAGQWFRLSYWKVATEEINYRRFFSINDLISLNVENQAVFAQVHALPLRLLEKGCFTGLRIDHIDGLYDPAAYLQRLREQAPETYLVAEKILEEQEPLPAWPIQGTTGYDFMNALNGVFCMTGSEKAFSTIYRRHTGLREPYAEMAYAKKKLIIEKHMFGDLNNLAHLLKNIAARHRYGSDITMDGLKRALIEVLALFPVYRSYLGSGQGRDVDSRYVEQAVDKAGEKNQGLRNELDYIRRVLLFQFEESAAEQESAQWLHFVRRFQQLSGPLMAKGLEDTLLYVYNRLLSLNEVGGNPERFGVSLESFHAFNRERLNKWPHALSATATHDTKRGEDVRARLNVLSEIPQEWERRVRGWSRINRPKKRSVRGSKAPDGNDEYFLYQTLVGALPLAEGDYPGFVRRIKAYLVKAVREAKVHTAWLKPDTDYEEAFVGFAEAVLSREGENSFLEDFLPFARMIAHYGMINSLAQTLVKITAPGVPDFYQGTEFWDLSLVDPDNRRPVDYATRQEALREISATAAGEIPGLIARLLDTREDGRIKLFLMHRALAVRRKHQLLFSHGEYRPLRVSGAKGEHVIAFARQSGERAAVIVAPRFPATLTEPEALPLGEAVWEDTGVLRPEDAGADWEEAVTGRAVHCGKQFFVGEVLQDFPVALLTNFRAKSGIR